MKKIGRITAAYGGAAIYWAVFIAGIRGNVYCFNVFKFLAWAFTIMSFTLFVSVLISVSAQGKPNTLKDEWSWPRWFGATQDLTMAVILAAAGHFVYAALLCIQQFFEYGIRTTEPPKKAPEPTAEQLAALTGIKPDEFNKGSWLKL